MCGYCRDSGRAQYVPITDDEAVQGFALLTKLEGIIPAIESAHALAHLEKLMPQTKKDEIVVVNISGRGDKDLDYVVEHYENHIAGAHILKSLENGSPLGIGGRKRKGSCCHQS